MGSKVKEYKWEKRPGQPNEIIEGDGFTISFNANPAVTTGISFFRSDDDGPETALIDEREGRRGICLVLNGDFRKDYERLIPLGYDACLAFYNEKKSEHRSLWSEDDA